MNMTTKITEELIFQNLDFETSDEALEFLASKLYEHDLVVENYIEAILAREEEYPTGLPAKINVAIPHTDSKYVNETSVSVGILNNSVKFKSMENPDNELDVQIIIMLAIKDSSKQLDFLQNVISLIQDEKALEKIIASKEKNTIKNILGKYL